jgi:DNA modification methylase
VEGVKRKTTILEDGSLYQEEDIEGERGANMGDVWHISIPNSQSKERLGYPTQKPLSLLERIVKASSNEGDTLLDPFCGYGTAVDAAEMLGRN